MHFPLYYVNVDKNQFKNAESAPFFKGNYFPVDCTKDLYSTI